MEWYHKAADQNDSGAMNNLGVMVEEGRGVPKDEAQALSWYRKAADLGNREAMSNIGNFYYSGKIVGQDYAEALNGEEIGGCRVHAHDDEPRKNVCGRRGCYEGFVRGATMVSQSRGSWRSGCSVQNRDVLRNRRRRGRRLCAGDGLVSPGGRCGKHQRVEQYRVSV